MRRILSFFVILYLFTACNNPVNINQSFIETIHLYGEPWNINDSLGRPFTIHEAGNFLIIRNDLFETKLTAASLDNPSKMFHFGKRGEGPNELIDPGPIMISQNLIDVYDGGKMTLLEFDLREIESNKKIIGNPLFRTELQGIISMIRLSDSSYLASGIFMDGRLCLMDNEGNLQNFFGSYPIQDDNEKELPFHVLGMAYQSLMCKQDNGNRIALATRYAEIMQIYEWNSKNQTIKDVCLISRSSPIFTTADTNSTPNFRPDKNTKWGYVSVDASEKYIYALYSGRLQYQDDMFYAGNEVHVFDWDGNPIYKLHIDDYQGTSIAVKNEKLYVLTEDENSGYDIVEFDLPIK